LVASISGSTLWRWLHQDAIRPWYHRCWIFPRDPNFAEKAGRILALYARGWEGKPLQDDEFVISADEKTSIQARRRKHPTRACRPRGTMQVEHEYFRCGAWTYIAGLDVHNARIFGRCETQNGIQSFDRLVEQVMTERSMMLAASSGSSTTVRLPRHQAVQRLQNAYPQLVLVHAPIHASWLNQVEIYFHTPAEGSDTQRFELTSWRSALIFSTQKGVTLNGSSPAELERIASKLNNS
jgi:hypothetical protein